MRDVGVLCSLLSFAALALWRPWLGVLGLAFFGYLQPHTYAGELSRELPVYKALFAATVVGTLFTRDRQLPPLDWRVLGLLVLWIYFFVTTKLSYLQLFAGPKFLQISGVFASTFLILILINTREKLFWLIAATALSFALVTLKGGYWTIIHGFSDRVYGPPGSQYADNNHFAVAAVMTIPLLMLWFQESSSRWLKGMLVVSIALSVIAALSSWSRGGLLALAVTLLLLLFSGGRRTALAAIPLFIACAAIVGLMPDDWGARMETIGSYQEDQSAQGRLFAWSRGLGYALNHPFTGSGFDGWIMVTWGRDWHSVYIEMMAEHGIVAFVLWISLIVGTLIGLTRLAWRYRASAESAWVVDYSTALRASLVAYCVGGAFLGITYWDFLYHLIAMAILLKHIETSARAGDQAGLQMSWNSVRKLYTLAAKSLGADLSSKQHLK